MTRTAYKKIERLDLNVDRYAYRKQDFLPMHPGRMLATEFMEPLGVTAYALAKAINVPGTRIHAIVNGRRAITADTSIRLGKYFGQSPEFFLGMQNSFDLAHARAAIGPAIAALPEHPRVQEAALEFAAINAPEVPLARSRKVAKPRRHLAHA